jgi:GNAT superfamily N-acetyltransferase
MSALQVRTMLPEEADRVSDVIVAAVRAAFPACYSPQVVEGVVAGNSPDAVRGHAGSQVDCVCLLDGRIAAMIGLKRNEIGHLFVHPEHTGRGIGRHLVEFAFARFRRDGYREAIVHASLNAEGFYRRCGFVAEGEGSFEVAPGVPLTYTRMRAVLPGA